MIARIVTWVSTLAALVLLISFGLFAIDQVRNGSNQQVSKIDTELGPSNSTSTPAPASSSSARGNVNQADPPPRIERARERAHGKVREAIDDADDVLLSPFTGVVDSNAIWVQRGIPSLIAFLIFAVGLRVLAAYLPGGGRR
jgi:hypothetical protein